MNARDEEAGADSRAAPERLWHNPDFVKLGTQLSSIAYPLTAVIAL